MSVARGDEWVEIVEPSSREKMFTNPSTGEIVFTPPAGATVKPMSSSQWWELFDDSTNRNYYYNAITGETVWNRPGNDADVISLTKLQSTSTSSEEPPPVSPGPTLEPVVEETHHKDEVFKAASNDAAAAPTQGTIENNTEEPTRKLSEMLLQELEPMSPFKVDFPNSNFGFTNSDLNRTEETTAHAHPSTTTTSTSPSPGPQGQSDIEMRQKKSRTLFGQADMRYQEHDRGSWVNIKLVKENARDSADSAVSDKGGGELLRPEERQRMAGSLDRTNRGRDHLTASTSYEEKAYTLEHRGSKRASAGGMVPVRPAPTIPNKTSPGTKVKSPSHEPVDEKVRSNSSAAAAPPVAPPFKAPARHATVSAGKKKAPKKGSALESFQDLAQHRSGLFRKKVTIANMLAWTKDPIKQPMIQTRDKQQKKEAVDMFKLLLQYMGDRKTKYKDPNLIALEIATRAWEKKGLRDELYIQLCRQTTSNDKPKSLERGWEMIAIALAFFPPSIRFRSYLEGYLWRHVEPLPQNKGVPVEVFAQYCHKKVEKMAQSGAKKGLKKPTLEEVVHAKRQPFNPSMFGTSLEEVMEMQKEKFSDHNMPWVVQALVDAVVELEGPITEGIFRVPGDIDEVNSLKLQMDKGHLPVENLRDPHVPASLLKLWFRELEDPLIPEEYYQDCIDNCENEVNAVSLVESLPELNKKVLLYLVRFLRRFVTDENISQTKMGLENIAMVWAPNFLRCPSEDHALIFQNTRKEMSFLRVLLRSLETGEGEEGFE